MINKDELIENKKINYEDMTKEEIINYTRLIEVTNNTLHEIILVKDKVITEMAHYIDEHVELINPQIDKEICCHNIDGECINRKCFECVEKYFYEKVEK